MANSAEAERAVRKKEAERLRYLKNKEVIKARSKQWRIDNADKRKSTQLAWEAANKEKVTSYKKKWADKNADKVNGYAKIYYARNKCEVKARAKLDRANNPDKVLRKNVKAHLYGNKKDYTAPDALVDLLMLNRKLKRLIQEKNNEKRI